MMVSCYQFSPEIFSIKSNFETIERGVCLSKERGVDLVVFPECALTGYVLHRKDELGLFDEDQVSLYINKIARLAKDKNINIIFGSLEVVEGEWVNACSVVDRTGVIRTQVKSHLPQIGVDRFVRSGSSDYEIYNIDEVSIGIMICYEARFPEVARCLSLAGADIIVHPTNMTLSSSVVMDALLPARAIENKVYVVSSNRVGSEGGLSFMGRSRVINPSGEIISFANTGGEELIVSVVDVNGSRDKSIDFSKSNPGCCGVSDIYEDRRPDLYSPLT